MFIKSLMLLSKVVESFEERLDVIYEDDIPTSVQVKILRKELREREKKAIVSILSRAEVGNRKIAPGG